MKSFLRYTHLFFLFLRIGSTHFGLLLKNLFHFTTIQSHKEIVVKKHGLPKGFPTVDLLDLFPAFNETVKNYTYLDGNSRVIDVAILMQLAKRYKDCVYLEIGSFRGESIVNIAPVAKECYSLSLSDEEMKKAGFAAYVPQNRFFSKHHKNITHIGHDSTTFDFSTLNKKFDLIFVDGSHEYLPVAKDTANVFKLLRDENSVIVWHDCGDSYESVRWTVQAGILDGCPLEAKNKIYRVSNSLCAIYTNEKLKTGFPAVPCIPEKVFEVTITGKSYFPQIAQIFADKK